MVKFQCLYLTSVLFVKSSICFALLRLNAKKSIKIILYITMAVSILSNFIAIVTVLSICRPVSAAWTGKGKCASVDVLVALSYIVSTLAIVTDFACSILPYVILWNLQMPWRLKFTVAGLLSLSFV